MAKKVLGIDLGASYYDAVVLEGGKPIAFHSSPAQKTTPRKFAESILESCQVDEIKVTGGRKSLAQLKFGSIPTSYVDELQALAEGARFLCNKDFFLVANVGTGTPLLFVSYSNHYHLGGTGLGGGTIAGLSKLLLHTTPQQTEKLALAGSAALDLSVEDIVGSGIGVVPASATASNLGKVVLSKNKKFKKQDIAFAIINSVAEPIAVMAVLAAREKNCLDRIFFTGRVSQNKFFQQRAEGTVRMFGGKCFFPKRGEYATAIGAALS